MMNRALTAILSVAFAGTAALHITPASAQRGAPAQRCNPPRPYLNYPTWYRDCEGVLQARWRDSNPYGLPYSEYVRMIWQMYEVQYFPDRHPSLVGSRCAPEGSWYVNKQGYTQICTGGRWRLRGH